MKMLRAFTVAALVVAVSAGAASAATHSWLGGNGDWDDAAKWDQVTFPTNVDPTVFNVAGTYTVTLDDSNEGSNIMDVNQGVVTIDLKSYTLNVDGDDDNATVYVGRNAGETGYLTITDSSTGTKGTFLADRGLWIGKAGVGDVTIKGGVQADFGYKLYFGGSSSPADSTCTIEGEGTFAQFEMAYAGAGDWIVQDKATCRVHGLDGGRNWTLGYGDGYVYGRQTDLLVDDATFKTASGIAAVGYRNVATMTVRNGGLYELESGVTPLILGAKIANASGTSDGSLTVTGAGSIARPGSIEIGGHDNTKYYGLYLADHSDAIGKLTVGVGALVECKDLAAAALADVTVYNSNSSINMNGGKMTLTGSLLMNGTPAVWAGAGNLNVQFDDAGAKGQIICVTAGETAEIWNVPITYSLLTGPFVPTVAGCYDFLIADTIDATGVTDNMAALLAAYPSYEYGIVTIDSDDYVGGAYDGYEAIRLSFLPGDADLGGLCDGADLLAWQNGYTAGDTTWDKGDYNLSGLVDGPDLLIWQNNYGKTLGDCSGMGVTGAAAAVPEPATLCLLGLGALALIRRRR